MKRFCVMLFLAGLCVAPGFAQDEDPVPANDWWQDTVWYEIFVRSFYDSDGDGIGDFQGIIEKLDYLNDGDPTTTDDPGITGIWLMPIMESVSYHGYDTIDYRAVEQDYGTKEDFQQLIAEAHARGIRVVVDYVINHSSNQHPWFVAAAADDPEFRDYYVWAEEDPGEAGPWGAVAWHSLADDDDYYYGVFWDGMPDLNYENPAVITEIEDAARFWLEEMGVDGFRLDAVRYVLEEMINDRRILQDSPGNRAILTDFNAFVHEVNPAALTIGEVRTEASFTIAPYVEENALDLAFEFGLAEAYLSAAGSGRKRDLERKMDEMGDTYPGYTYASFLTNHDDPRVITELGGNVGDAKVAASLLLLSPGTPFIYYGEEIGMKGTKPDELIRTPMQWDDTPVTGGFTSGEPWQPLTDGFENVTVAGQNDDPDSLLNHYRSLVQFRNTHEALRRGDFLPVDTSYRGLYSFIRRTENETLLVVINLDDEPLAEYSLDFDEGVLSPVESATLLMGDGAVAVPEIAEDGSFEEYVPIAGELAAQTAYVIQLR